MKLCVALIASCVGLVLPTGALAARCAPPGNSGVNQYYETVPGASCNGSPPGQGRHGGHTGVPRRAARQLTHQGSTGRAVAALVAASGTVGTARGGSGPGSGGSAPSGSPTGGSGPATSNANGGQGATTGRQAASAGAGATAPNVDGRGFVSALLHPILTGASSAGGAGIWLPIFLGVVFLLAVAALIRRSRLMAARRRRTN